jgi:hypothetical protein
MRDFDAERLGNYEADAWVAYYRRRWFALLVASLGLVREGFGLSWPRAIGRAWLVLRANQVWAPYPDNDPDRARAYMRRFYADISRINGETFDIDEAARLEVEWWRVHRYLQRGGTGGAASGRSAAEPAVKQPRPSTGPDGATTPLVEALAALYAHIYAVPVAVVRGAAAHRAEAMRISDRWVEAGCDPTSDAIAAEREELVKGYKLLRAAVAR